MKFTTIAASVLACSSIISAFESLDYVPTHDGKIRIADTIKVKWSTNGTYVRRFSLLILSPQTNATIRNTKAE